MDMADSTTSFDMDMANTQSQSQSHIQTQTPVLDAYLSSGQPRKLRESCTQCASSKVKCNKAKPTCGRCMRRGMSCEYGISRRTGRNRAPSSISLSALPTPSRSPQPLSRHGTSSSVGGYFQHARRASSTHSISIACGSRSPTPQCSPMNTPLITTPLHTPQSVAPQQEQDYWASMGSDVDELLANLTTPDFPDVDPADLDPSSLLSLPHDPFTDFDMSLSDPLEDGFLSSTTSIDNSTLCFDDISSSSDTSFKDGCLSSASSTSSTSSNNNADIKPRGACCLMTVFNLMMQLFPNAATGCTMPGKQQDGSCSVRTIESVISENKQVIESITKLMDCPCSQDEYVVTIISLVVFKVMGWYAAVASESSQVDDLIDWNSSDSSNLTTSSSLGEQVLHLPTTVGNYCVDGSEQSRMAAQLVLGELHRVTRLVNMLSQRLEDLRLRNKPSNGAIGSIKFGPALSVPTFEQLEQDLRKRLKAVSSETIELLRRT
ncbi:zinc finger transcription factor [Seiridium cupressi]